MALVALSGCGEAGTPDLSDFAALRGPEFVPTRVEGLAPCSSLPGSGRVSEDELLPDLRLSCLTSGRPVDLRDISGQPVLVNLWSTWCEPCRDEMPRLQRAYEEFGQSVAFLGVDTLDHPQAAGELLQQVGVTYPQLADPDAELLEFTRVAGLPVTLLLDADGTVIERHIGELSEDDIADLIQSLP